MMRTAIHIVLCLMTIALAPEVPAQAQVDDFRHLLLWEQVLAEVGDQDNDGVIQEEELKEFLRSKESEVSENMQQTGLNFAAGGFENFVSRKANEILNNLAPSPGPSALGIDNLEEFAAWQVTTTLKIKDLLTTSLAGLRLPEEKQSFLDWLEDRIDVRKSYLDAKGVGLPASMTWTFYGGKDETLKTDQDAHSFDVVGAIAISPDMLEWEGSIGKQKLYLFPALVIETDLSTDASTGRDNIRHRIGGEALLPGNTKALNVWGTFDYTTDRDYEKALLGFSFQLSPTLPRLGIGQFIPQKAPVYFRWRPYIGATGAHVEDPGDDEKLEDFNGYVNPFLKTTVVFLVGQRLELTADGALHKEMQNTKKWHGIITGAIQLLLDENGWFRLQLSHQNGEDSPEFIRKQVTRVSLNIKL